MGTRTYQHRRTLSNTSSMNSSHRGSNVDYGEVLNMSDLDYRYNNFNSIQHHQPTTLTAEPLKFNSVPYSVNSKIDTSNSHPVVVPDRMRLYENITNLQLQQLRDSHVPSTPSRQSQNVQHSSSQQIKTTHIETIQTNDLSRKMITTSVTAANALRREMFFSSVDNHQAQQNELKEQHLTLNSKYPGSTGCTPTHSTPQDSFSDDSSYLSALSSMNRVRFSPDNFLEEANNATLSPTNRIAVANLQRAMAQRTIELEEGEKWKVT